jgi:competence protein ComEC
MPLRDPNAPAHVAPMVPVALVVVAGIVVDRHGDPWSTIAWAGIAIVFAVVGLGSIRWRWPGAFAFLFACASLAGAWHHYRWSDLAGNDLARSLDESPRPIWLRGVIVDLAGFRPGRSASDSGLTRGVLEVVGVSTPEGWRPASGSVALTIEGDRSDLDPGAAVECAGAIALVAGPRNPGEFDYRAFLRGHGIRLRLSVDDPSGVWPDDSGMSSGLWFSGMKLMGAVRGWSQRSLARGFRDDTAPLAIALLLGRREGVNPDVNDAFARTGTTHLLAISGLHMQVLAWSLGLGLRLIGVGRRSTFALVIAATVGYTALVGLMPSVVRSAAMTVTACLAGLFDRRNGNANTFATAVVVTLVFNPSDLFDVGCQLSFLAVAAILWIVGPLLERWRPTIDPLDRAERSLAGGGWLRLRIAGRWLVEAITVSSVVWLAALPLTALRFHLAAPISILLNIPLVPMTSAALLASGVSLGLSSIWAPLGRPAAWLASLLLEWTETIVRWGASQRWGHVFVAEPSWIWVLGLYLLLGLTTTSWLSRWKKPARIACTICAALWTASGFVDRLGPRAAAPLRAEVLAVGHGLAVVIETGDGHAVLYDCGRMRDPSVGRRIIAPALWARGVRRLDAVILSHADSDHYNGLPDLLDRFTIGKVLVTEGFESASTANVGAGDLLDLVRNRGIPIKTIEEGVSWVSGSGRFSVRHPPEGWNPSAPDNARSIVLEVGSEGGSLLLTGDLEGEGLPAFLASSDSSPDVFLAPHHGGRTANPAWLYERLRPGQVVVSQQPPQAGARDALTPIEEEGTPVLRTWRCGAIRLLWNGSGIRAEGYLDQKSPPSE